jgi:hypothetical protein
MMSTDVIYSDHLIELSHDSILLRDFFYPFRSKRVVFSEIAHVLLEKPTLWTGKYRIYGTGDFRTWFGPDMSRASRDRIFVLHPKRGWWRMGFTAVDSTAVEEKLRERGLSLIERP